MTKRIRSKNLRPNLERFFSLISGKSEGDMVNEQEILASAGWAPATLRTHRDKNALAPFLIEVSPGNYRVRRNGLELSRNEVAQAFTQVRPAELVLSAGARLRGSKGEYELLAELGRGAVAHVWSATLGLDSKTYALKIMNPRPDLLEPSTLDNVKKRFSREGRNGQRLVHDHIIRYVDSGDYQGHPFLVMMLADESLARILKTKLLGVAQSLNIIEQCAQGLYYLHSQGCVHRDVKPHNILRFDSNFVLGDLGIVNWSDLSSAFTSAGTLTRDSIQLGSWYYMSPEQRSSPHHATSASDLYALGVSWYEMLTGRTPDPAAIAAQAFDDPCTDSSVNSLIRRMLRFDAMTRPSAADLESEVHTLRARL